MALPNSTALTSGGEPLATHTIGGVEAQACYPLDGSGHVEGTLPAYLLYQEPRVMTAAATDLWDLYNTSSSVLRIRGLWPLLISTAAHAFTIPWRFNLQRTTSAGTGGTAHTTEASAPAAGAVSLNKMSPSAPALPAGVTARSVPTGGAAAGTLLWPMSYFLEEGSTANGVPQLLAQFLNTVPELPHDQPLEVHQNGGLKLRQITATASTGCGVGWLMAFTVQ
jgi:hypothetical protein